jgi:MFS family permease
VYLSQSDKVTAGPRLARPVRASVGANVLFLGLTSLFTDISSEMVGAIVPLYLTVALGFSAFQFGLFDGAQQCVIALLRIVAGVAADRRRRYKEVAGVGYGLSALCKLGLFLTGTVWVSTVGLLVADRVGKGIRTAPRDALLSLSAPKERLAEAFGVHRALDTAGALLGPIVAFGILAAFPGRFDAIFLISFCVALIGLGVLILFVENRSGGANPRSPSPLVSWRAMARVFRLERFPSLVAAGTILGLATISDAFVYLVLQRRTEIDPRYFPIFYVGTALSYLLFAIPAGRLADRAGRRRVFLLGYVLLAVVYGLLLLPSPGLLLVMTCLFLHGAYYAATDGVLNAVAATTLSEDLRATGLSVLSTFTTLGRFLAVVSFGACWSWRGPEAATTIFAVGLAAAIGVSVFLFPRRSGEVST